MQILNSFGIHISEDSEPIFTFACVIFVLAVVGLLCFINIILYFVIFYITENEVLLSRLSD